MKYKPDWPEARERFMALWEDKPTDRPCIAVAVSRNVRPLPKRGASAWLWTAGGPSVEPPNGVAHLAMYRQIQVAGRIVHIQVTKDQVEPLCRALDPRPTGIETDD